MNDNEYEIPLASFGLLFGIRNAALISVGFWLVIYFLARVFGA